MPSVSRNSLHFHSLIVSQHTRAFTHQPSAGAKSRNSNEMREKIFKRQKKKEVKNAEEIKICFFINSEKRPILAINIQLCIYSQAHPSNRPSGQHHFVGLFSCPFFVHIAHVDRSWVIKLLDICVMSLFEYGNLLSVNWFKMIMLKRMNHGEQNKPKKKQWAEEEDGIGEGRALEEAAKTKKMRTKNFTKYGWKCWAKTATWDSGNAMRKAAWPKNGCEWTRTSCRAVCLRLCHQWMLAHASMFALLLWCILFIGLLVIG